MKYLKVFTDFAEDIGTLNDGEVGRLFRAMLLYAETGTAPDLKGNEKYLWGTAKKNIDNQLENYETMCRTNKRIATERNAPSRSVTANNEALQDKDKDKDKEKEKIKKRKVFIPPTVAEVEAYCAERNNGIDAQSFVDWYAAKDWRIGKDKMVDWKAAVRTWERKNGDKHQQTQGKWNIAYDN